jgi:GAF domain-containing protein
VEMPAYLTASLLTQNDPAVRQIREYERVCDALMRVVIPIGAELFYERDFNKLLERILVEVKNLCRADAGTLYLVKDDQQLEFVIIHNTSLKIAMGGTSGVSPPFGALALRDPESGQPNHRNIATYVALTGESVSIPDAYTAPGFDFSGTRAFDARTGYRSVSFVAVPLKNTQGQVIGVLQMINAIEPDTGCVVPFDPLMARAIESLGMIAAAALEQHVREQQLRQQIQELKVEIDQVKRERQVREITQSDYFRDIQGKIKRMKERSKRSS